MKSFVLAVIGSLLLLQFAEAQIKLTASKKLSCSVIFNGGEKYQCFMRANDESECSALATALQGAGACDTVSSTDCNYNLTDCSAPSYLFAGLCADLYRGTTIFDREITDVGTCKKT